MPVNASVAGPPIAEADAEEHVHGISFKTGPPALVGAELEWLVRDVTDPARPVEDKRITEVLNGSQPPGVLPGGGILSREPGGQVELSTAPADLAGCVAAGGLDLAGLRRALGTAGLALAGYGLDPLRGPRRLLDLPRYAAMDDYFCRRGPWGRVMMCSTASVQVCVDAGEASASSCGYRFRWRLLHALSPVLIAAFANSPLRRGRPTGWKSARQMVWLRIDPCRTRPPRGAEPGRLAPGWPGAVDGTADPALAWARYALDAEVMCVRRPDGQPWTAPDGLTFRAWLRGAGERPPTRDDLEYHLSTLFPPVRPRGHLELRVIDAQPGDGWIVPVALVAGLLGDPAAADAAMAVAEPLWRAGAAAGATSGRARWPAADLWTRAARLGPSDPELGAAARRCLEIAHAALGRLGAPAAIRDQLTDFCDRYAGRGRCPADDLTEVLA